jgi:hypothetical protein
MFHDYNEVRTSVHTVPIGCVNDLCLEKKSIILKLRTADVCIDCMDKLRDKLSVAEIQQALKIMESLRVKMLFSQNFKQSVPLSKMIIERDGSVTLPDFGNIEIKLKPLEKAFYKFYLDHPEGLGLYELRSYKNDLVNIYINYIKDDDGGFQSVQDLANLRIEDVVNNTKDTASILMSKIKTAFVRAIGAELAKNYYIQGANGEIKKIKLNRDLVQFEV